MELTSRFLTVDDKQINKMDDFNIPETWWSRPYEYYLASQFLSKKDIILDAACGIGHPFKYYASKRVKKCYAVDIDEGIKDLKGSNSLEFRHADISNLCNEFKDNTFDKIFCISVLEHIPEKALIALDNFKKLIKPGGTIIITIDYPFITPDDFIHIVNVSGLQYVGSVDYKIPKNAIRQDGLKVYTAILTKEPELIESEEINNIQEEKIIEDEKVKEIKPSETKPLYKFETK